MSKRFLRAVKKIIVRLYAFAIVLVVLAATVTAVVYLVTWIFFPAPVPAQFREWQGRVDVEEMRKPRAAELEWAPQRAPVSHFHLMGNWVRVSPHDGCTISGCHSPLPHARHQSTRAFANFHATFLTCQMCHLKDARRPVPSTWVATPTGRPEGPPAILRLARMLDLETKNIESNPAAVNAPITQMLTETLQASGPDQVLHYILVELQTSEPGSPVWTHAVKQLAEELQIHMRGEYGARVASVDTAKEYLDIEERCREQAASFQAAAPDSSERRTIHGQIHAGQLTKPRLCMACHIDTPPFVDFKELGYWPKRVAELRSTPIVREVLRIHEGKPFYLPNLLGSQPSSRKSPTSEPKNAW